MYDYVKISNFAFEIIIPIKKSKKKVRKIYVDKDPKNYINQNKSCLFGILLYRHFNNEIEYLVVQDGNNATWRIPKVLL